MILPVIDCGRSRQKSAMKKQARNSKRKGDTLQVSKRLRGLRLWDLRASSCGATLAAVLVSAPAAGGGIARHANQR